MRGEEGKVVVKAEISTGGKCVHAVVLTSSGSAVLDAAAIQAVDDARFAPASRDGNPVEGDIMLTFDFQLRD